MSLNTFFRHFNLESNPFGTWMAEDETRLAEWFVPPPFFRSVLGFVPEKETPLPVSHVVFGGPGCGKTALRLEMERELLRSCPNALVLGYVDFSEPLSGTKEPSLGRHIEEVLRLGTIGLLGAWERDLWRYNGLQLVQKAELFGLIMHYYESLPDEARLTYVSKAAAVATRGWCAVVLSYNTLVSVLKREQIEPADWNRDPSADETGAPHLRLRRFWYLAEAMGIDAMWVLVDAVDEVPSVRTGEDIFLCLRNLLLSQNTIEFRNDGKQVVCFKFFLTKPGEVQPALDADGFRKDRVRVETIEWKRAELERALEQRLAYFTNKLVLNFDKLCAPSSEGTQDLLLDKCELRPRTLFRMANEILRAFELRDEPGVHLLDSRSIELGIAAGLEAVVG